MSGAAAEAPEETSESLDFGGWKPTGRKTAGPDSELVEVENPDGHKQTAIVYDKAWRDHHRLTTDVELVQSFMEFPMVEGLSCLSRAPAGQGLFQYDTGSVLALIEVLRGYRDQRKKVGQKAAFELLVAVTEMLQGASENGPMHGIYSHGGITPWRVTLNADGEPELIGYGLPQMDMVALREDDSLRVRDDSYKYCPPERITSGYEDISTDIYSMVLIAYEMIAGESLLTGSAKDLKRAVELGEAQGLMQSAKGVDKKLKAVFVKALAFDPIGRFEEPHEFMEALQTAAGGREFKGDTLAEVMANVRRTTRRGKALMDVGTAGGARRMTLGERETRMKSAGAARPVRGRAPAGRSQDVNVSSDGRWGKVRRSAEEEAEEAATGRSSVAGRPSRRRRGGSDESATSSVASRPSRRRRGGASDDEEEASSSVAARPSRRRRGGGDDEETPAATRPTRRRRGSSDDEDEDAPAATRPSRRRRGSSDDEDDETPAATRPSRRRRGSSGDDESEDASPRTSRSSRRRGSSASDSADAEPAEEESTSPRRSRSRSRTRASDETEDKAEETVEEKAEDKPEEAAEDKPTRSRSRRSRTKATDDEASPESEESAEDKTDDEPEDKPTRSRSRRSRTKASDDEDKPAEDKDKDEDEDDGESKPTRSRRTRASSRGEAGTSARSSVRRSRSRSRTRATDDDDKDGDDKPTRTRSRSRAKPDADGDDDTPKAKKPAAKKPTRKRRSSRAKKKDE